MLHCLLSSVLSAPADDAVHSLPGWTPPLPSPQFSGYLNISHGTKHIHYWFVEAEGDTSNAAPIALWVQGGPGGSSMTGMWTENMGPFAVNLDSVERHTLQRSQFPWTRAAHMLFWEAPAGVGFSYCDGGPCPHYNDTSAAIDNAETICAWLDKFPEYKGHPFYIVGESYAGVYIPTVALQLRQTGLCGGALNLKGLMIGNGCTGTDAGTCSPGRFTFTIKQLFQQAMVSEPTKAAIDTLCADSMGLTEPSALCAKALAKASDEAGPYNHYNVHDTCGPPTRTLADAMCDALGSKWACDHVGRAAPTTIGEVAEVRRRYREVPTATTTGHLQHWLQRSAQDSAGPAHQPENYFCGGEEAMGQYLARADVRAAIHVKAPPFPGSFSYSRSWPNLLVSPGYPDLIADERLRVLIYSGDFDGQIPHSGTEEWTRGLGVPLANGSSTQSYYRPWKLANGQVAGRVVQYENDFAYVTVAGAGHMVPTFKPEEGFELFRRFVSGETY